MISPKLAKELASLLDEELGLINAKRLVSRLIHRSSSGVRGILQAILRELVQL